MSDPRIIVYCGVIGSGKDHCADQKKTEGYWRIDFKDELIAMISDLCGYNILRDYDWFKQHIPGIMRPSNPILEGMKTMERKNIETCDTLLMTGRRLLQRFGTDVMRKRDPDYWVKAYSKKTSAIINSGGRVVTADCRFMNEVEAIKSLDENAKFFFCDYRSERYDSKSKHESEILAQLLLSKGVKGGQEIHFGELKIDTV